MRSAEPTRTGWWLVLAGAAVAIAVLVLLVPSASSETCTASSAAGRSVCTRATTSLLSTEGFGVLVPLSVPVVLCLLGAAFRSRVVRRVVAVLITAFCVVGGFSVGLLFLPVAVGALVVAFSPGPSGPPVQHPHSSATA